MNQVARKQVTEASPEPAPAPMLACERLSFRYRDGTLATRDISLAMLPGELFCLLGPNGAGKTTLVRLLSGGMAPSSGRVLLGGRVLETGDAARAAQLGVIPQSAGLFEGLGVEAHLRAFGPLKGLRGKALSSEVERVIAELGIDQLRSKRVGALSGGQQR
ncbi:MAG TPA: ATP-binding cassette domain-containing protein, partial [Kofleriaceae bacterium]|nr:ATP-binding cassette domain-containing protein [Kofleriaceae bacterium]